MEIEAEEIIRLNSLGISYEDIAIANKTTKSAISGRVWRYRNKDKHRNDTRDKHNSKVITLTLPSSRVKRDLYYLAEKERKTVSKLCFELIIAGYRAKYAEEPKNDEH